MKELILHDAPLVFGKNDEAYTDSFHIAECAQVERRAVIQLIQNHMEDIQDFGRVTFEMRPFETQGSLCKRSAQN